MVTKLTEVTISAFKLAAKLLTGARRREYIAKITKEFLDGNARKAERVFGWGRSTVIKGLRELDSNIECMDNYSARGNKKTEYKNPELAEDIRSLVEPESQTDPCFKTPFRYTRVTAKKVRELLIEEKGWSDDQLPTENTIGNMLNRMGYKIRSVQKAKPVKKIPETDEIFENTKKFNREADDDENTLRVSIDVKAKVNIGELSRGGKSRGKEAEKAHDHDMNPVAKLVPVGFLEPASGNSTIFFGTSNETSDLIVDCLEQWWEKNIIHQKTIAKLVINLDNGPHVHSRRTWFIKRMTEFADKTGLEIHLIYYPPYHSKYNPIERLWGILESHWNGSLLSSIDDAIEWAKSMTWKGIQPVVRLLEKAYETGKKLTEKEMRKYEERIQRSDNLPKWDVVITPVFG